MIKYNNINVGFQGKIILENISLTIEDGESVAVVGKSGSGKTVLMKCLEKLINPISGEIEINKRKLSQMNRDEIKETRKKFAMLFQNAGLFDSLNIFQNVAFPLVEHKNLDENEISQIVTEKLLQVGLSGIEGKMPSELSGGMRKRVGIARALVMEPELIIYDEPTTGLDPIIGMEIINLIKKMQNSYKMTSIIISHDLECVKRTAERVIMIHDKKIHFDGNLVSFLNSEDQEVKDFIGVYKNA